MALAARWEMCIGPPRLITLLSVVHQLVTPPSRRWAGGPDISSSLAMLRNERLAVLLLRVEGSSVPAVPAFSIATSQTALPPPVAGHNRSNVWLVNVERDFLF